MAIVLVFAGLGTALITGSHAATPGDSAAAITLAPATASLRQGQVINIAVNVNTNGETAKNIDAFVQYPTAALQLQSVQYACQLPFTSGTHDSSTTSTSGTAVVSCANPNGIEGDYTMATLVFKALADTSDAPITVNDSSTVVRKSDSKKVLGHRQNATMQLQPAALSATKTPRANPNYKSVKLGCTNPAPGEARCNARRSVTADGQPVASAAAAATGYGPTELHTAYQLPCTPGGPVAAVCATPSAYTTTIAITDAGNYTTGVAGLESDLKGFSQKYGIPPCTVANGCLSVVSQTGSSTLPAPYGDWSGEIILDVEAAHVICQTCKIVLVAANTASLADLTTAHKYAASLKPITISDSWSGTSTGKESDFNYPGIAQVIADGDDGIVTGNNYPADYPGVVVASGTTLKVNTDGSRASETLVSWSGSGCSKVSAAPAWQKSLANWATAGCGTQRAYGDIAADADNENGGLAVYQDGAWSVSGGTSLSAPIIAGMFALANNLPTTMPASQMLYVNYAANPAAFFDITTGTNCITGVTAHCTAGVGYDAPSGLGVPTLAAVKSGGTTTPPTPPPTPTPTPPTPTPTPTPPTPTPTPPPSTGAKVGDLNGDNKVNISDMSILLSAWGKNNAAADLNKSGKVDISDLSILLSHWNT